MGSLPDDYILPWDVFRLSDSDLGVDARGVQRSGDLQDDVVGIEFGVKRRFEMYRILDSGFRGLRDVRLQSEREVDVGCRPVSDASIQLRVQPVNAG